MEFSCAGHDLKLFVLFRHNIMGSVYHKNCLFSLHFVCFVFVVFLSLCFYVSITFLS